MDIGVDVERMSNSRIPSRYESSAPGRLRGDKERGSGLVEWVRKV